MAKDEARAKELRERACRLGRKQMCHRAEQRDAKSPVGGAAFAGLSVIGRPAMAVADWQSHCLLRLTPQFQLRLSYGKRIDPKLAGRYGIVMSSIERQIRDSIESFVAELNRLVRQAAVAAVKNALGGNAAPARRPAGGNGKAAPAAPRARSRRSRRGRRVKRSPRMLAKLQNALLEEITLNPGQRIEAIGKTLGVPTKDLNLPVKRLLASKQIKKKGEKRATEYSAS